MSISALLKMRRVVSVLMCVVLSACAVTRGAPRPPIAAEVLDPKSTDPQLTVTRQDVVSLESVDTPETRNALTTKAMFAIDLRYAEYRHSIWAERRNTGAWSAFLSLGLGVAGTLTDAVAAKGNYAALGTLLTGSTQVVDSKYLFDQTVSALITTMDANRTAVAKRLMESLNLPIGSYSGYASLRDLIDYYNAGTLTDALITLQDRASVDKQQNVKALARIPSLSTEEITVRGEHTKLIYGIKADDSTRPAMLAALKALGVTDVSANALPKDVRERLITEYQGRVNASNSDDDVFTALRANHLLPQ